MSEAEKMAERLEAGAFDFNADGPCWPGDDMAEAAALIRRLQAENEAKNVKQVGLVEALNRIEHEAVIRPKYRAVETVSDLRQIARAAIEEVNRE
jgi:hypothetical protein